MKILAISGSLRAASLNSLLLRAVARMAPAGSQFDIYLGLGTVDEACIAVPLLGSGLDEEGVIGHAEIRSSVLRALSALEGAVMHAEAEASAFPIE